MKLNIPFLRKCALGVTLLSLTHLTLFANEASELSLKLSEETLTAEQVYPFDVTEDFLFSDPEFASNLVTKNRSERRKRVKQQEESPSQGTIVQADNTWVPRFVWVGDVENDENLKCFAAFLIGSLSDPKSGQNDHKYNPALFMGPKSSNTADSNYHLAARSKNANHGEKQNANSLNLVKQTPNTPKQKGIKPPKPRITLDLRAGATFLMFTEYQGNLAPVPPSFYGVTKGSRFNLPVHGKVRYNVNPMIEMNAVYNFFKYFALGAYLQSSQGIFVNSKPIAFRGVANQALTTNFQSLLDLNAVGGKAIFNLPNLFRFKTWCLGVYASGGVGVGFQTWKNASMNLGNLESFGNYTTNTSPFGVKYMTNLSYLADAGFNIKSRNPFALTTLKFGCTFTGWGRTKGLGKVRAPQYPTGLWKPISYKGIFSLVPYIGFTWSF